LPVGKVDGGEGLVFLPRFREPGERNMISNRVSRRAARTPPAWFDCTYIGILAKLCVVFAMRGWGGGGSDMGRAEAIDEETGGWKDECYSENRDEDRCI
jgi:hypothetical protein